MGRHSDSDSGGSRRDYKKRSSGRSRSPSGSKSGNESSASHHRKKLKSKKDSKSRSPSKSKTDDRSRTHQQNRSSSRERTSSSRSQPSKYRKSRSRSPSHSNRSRHRSRSRSREKSKYDKSSSRSSENGSKDKSKYDKTSLRSGESSAKLSPIPEVVLTQDQQLKLKMQMAFKAAAEADAQLRQKGILPSGKAEVQAKLSQPKAEVPAPVLSVQEQMSKAQAITAINAQGFEPSNFVSARSITQEAALSKSIMDNHDAVIFGTNSESRAIESQLSQKATAAFESIIKDDLIHPNLFADTAAKQERWIRRLYNMRLKKLNGEAMS